MRPIQPIVVAMWLVALVLLLRGSDGSPTIIGEKPPFKAAVLDVMIVEESTERGKYPIGQREIMEALTGANSAREYTTKKGGNFIVVDDDNKLETAPAWVKEARQALPANATLPWLIAATPRAGLNKALPVEAAQTMSDLKRLGGE